MTGHLKKTISVLSCFICLCLAISSADCAGVSASVVSDRIAQVVRVYPGGDKMNELVVAVGDNGEIIYNGGCNALVAYTTLKVFHNAWTPGAGSYSKIGGTASTSSAQSLKNLFAKAKKGDVVVFRTGSGKPDGSSLKHVAIFLSASGSGVYLYENNFQVKNLVWYNHFWPYSSVKSWARGATGAEVYRSKNYQKVNKKKSAKFLKTGKKFTLEGITYKVTSNKIGKGSVKVIKKRRGSGRIPKAIGVNDGYFTAYTKIDKVYIYDQQYFTVRK